MVDVENSIAELPIDFQGDFEQCETVVDRKTKEGKDKAWLREAET